MNMKLISLMIITGIFISSQSMASSLGPNIASSIEYQSIKSDLIFKGSIEKIKYGKSMEGILHTFVTYRIDTLISGNYSPKNITLRFIGGEERIGDVVHGLIASNAPKFQKGQRDILMVKGNGLASCPLVQCAQGRYRLINGSVSSEDGVLFAKGRDGHPILASQNQTTDTDRSVGVLLNPSAKLYSENDFTDYIKIVAYAKESLATTKSANNIKVKTVEPGIPFSANIAGPQPGPRTSK